MSDAFLAVAADIFSTGTSTKSAMHAGLYGHQIMCFVNNPVVIYTNLDLKIKEDSRIFVLFRDDYQDFPQDSETPQLEANTIKLLEVSKGFINELAEVIVHYLLLLRIYRRD